MPLVAAVTLAWALVLLTPLLVRLTGRHVGWSLGLGLLASYAILVGARDGEAVFEELPWVPALDIALRLRMDGLSFLFATVVLVVGAIVLIYSTSYLRARASTGFYMMMSAFAAAMLTLVLADDIVVLFIAWELTTICSFLLILRSGQNARKPATRTLFITAGGGQALLGAVVLMIATTGTTQLSAILADGVWRDDPVFTSVVTVLVAVAAMTKSAQFPFHSWLPDAMVAPAPVSAYLHAAAMVKAGIFLLMLFAPVLAETTLWHVILIPVGLVTNIMGAVFAIRSKDIKQIFAYSTVSQLGLLVAVIGIGTPLAMMAASAHVIAHALFKASGFMAVGVIERRTGTRDVRELRGLWRGMPWLSPAIVLAVASMAGVPPLLGFVTKELVIDTFVSSGSSLAIGLIIVIVGGAALTVAYSVRLLVPIMVGPRAEVAPWRDSAVMSGSVAVTGIAGLVLGVGVAGLTGLVRPAAAVSSGSPVADLPTLYLWHGFTIPLLGSVAALVAGTALALFYLKSSHAVEDNVPGTLSATGIVQATLDGIISSGHRVGNLTRHDSPAANLAVPIGLVAAAAFALPALWRGMPEHVMGFDYVDALLLVMVVIGTVVVVRARSRLTALIMLAVVGFAAVLWFFVLGASDVALTQLLVEVLTVVVLVLVLNRMPRMFDKGTRMRKSVTVPIALLAGVTATLATLTFSGHRDLSDAGAFFLSEAEELTGGTNVVNTILVDFRALDTLGELVVLSITAVSLTALLDARRLSRTRHVPVAPTILQDPVRNVIILRDSGRFLIPVMIVISLYALVRGHGAPGGGFIAALIGAAGLATVYHAAPTNRVASLDRSYLGIAGFGIIVAVVTGFLGFAEGSFLRPLHLDIAGIHVTTALIFDLGVYFAVLGVILAAINRLGMPQPIPADAPTPTGARTS